ncbi:MAG: HlyD family efflux transporter periplasmic adaptor subunit, partial [Planctomycetota bacterium]|nr:HlyD family efflux transporter periplasmic adaptor subunit [Planctomycetota bacterium]
PPTPLLMTAISPTISSTQRPIPLIVRDDLVTQRIRYQGEGYWVIKDPVALSYYRLQPAQYHALTLLDGTRSLEQLRELLRREFPSLHLTLAEIQHLVTDLHQKGLVYSQRTGQGANLLQQRRNKRKKKIWATLANIMYLRLPGWDPEVALTILLPYFRWLFKPWGIALSCTIIVASWILMLVGYGEFQSRLPEFQSFFGWPNLMWLWITLGFAKILHEFGHGLACKHYGGECHDMGILLLVFSPCMYCDVSDSWMLPSKWQRIFIGGAGMYVEVLLSALCVFGWWYSEPGLFNHLCLNLFFVSTVTTVIFNANPLMRFDGYYMMSDFLEIPNLRPKSDKLLRDNFSWYCLGIESQPDPFMPDRGRIWFMLFAVASWFYKWFITFGIIFFLYTMLKPYELQSIGIALACISATSIVGGLVFNCYRILTAPRLEPMNKKKVTATMLVFASILAGALFFPFPWHDEASLLIEPTGMQSVYNVVPGQLDQINVRVGDPVQAGQVLATFVNPELDDRIRVVTMQIETQRLEVRMFQTLDDIVQKQLADEKLLSLEKQLSELELQRNQLTVVAPIGGIAVDPPQKKAPTREALQSALAGWSGVPLHQRNIGSYMDAGTHLLSIAPGDGFEAILYVDQADRNDFRVEQPVEMRFDHIPGKTFHGEISSISERHLEFAPVSISNKTGGNLPTVTDSQGRERLTSHVYQATVDLADDLELMRTHMRGQARVHVGNRSLVDWIWRYLTRTFHFRL